MSRILTPGPSCALARVAIPSTHHLDCQSLHSRCGRHHSGQPNTRGHHACQIRRIFPSIFSYNLFSSNRNVLINLECQCFVTNMHPCYSILALGGAWGACTLCCTGRSRSVTLGSLDVSMLGPTFKATSLNHCHCRVGEKAVDVSQSWDVSTMAGFLYYGLKWA